MKRIFSTLVSALVAVAFAGVVFAADTTGGATGTSPSPSPEMKQEDQQKPAKKTKKAKKKKSKKAKKSEKQETAPATTESPAPATK